MGMEISGQSEEIEKLNQRYRQAVSDKLTLYEDFTESVKEVNKRDARFLLNELEMCRLVNEASIIKRELEQRERSVEELWKSLTEESDQPEFISQV